MSYIKALIQLLIAIPKVFELLKGLWDLYDQSKKQAEEKKRLEAIEKLKQAKTDEEIFRANRDVTNHLP